MDVQFFFDAMCPWTWLTSRWLVDVAAQKELDVTWRPFSLAVLNEGKPIPPALLAAVPDIAERQALGVQVLRMVQALHDAGRNDDIGHFYRAVGEGFHVQGLPVERSALKAAAAAAGVEDQLGAAEEGSWDAPVRASTDEAVAQAGPDVGSPVLLLDGGGRGIFGPIVSPPPQGEDAARLWDAVVMLQALPDFLELKRGRLGPPTIPGRT